MTTETDTQGRRRRPSSVAQAAEADPGRVGFFDPEQCGFAALLAKLDEITDGVEDVKVRRS